MHPNPIFRRRDRAAHLEMARDRGFGVLTLGQGDRPLAAHLPFLLSDDGLWLEAHMARSNPVLRELDEPREALLVVNGPDAYISPDWYGVEDQVPTWNYTAVHLRGPLERCPQEELRPHLRRLSDAFETRLGPKPVWRLDKVGAEALARLERMIVPVRMHVREVDGTWKLSQNKPDAARHGAADGVAGGTPGLETGRIAEMMADLPPDATDPA
ncbi:FMN-binding negative transcriptional regulator [Oceanomicrobium pacificus]|uniref:FMN-binding negative transcriptional regulator n=1 Tax=Oceanomicrobium pacificus TaxID=2692916 RepID=A0A6B0TRU5_9RHOB|nr:FMN-binding negative transcriptional regulator [Oceanomicrobium pacificus]MXU64535.1 FMN-binding negative transcriptional regulator [Oceanomicrobium pacificus]